MSDNAEVPWCLAPFVSLFQTADVTTSCCELFELTPYNTKPEAAESFLDSERIKSIRKSFLNYDLKTLPKTCQTCLKTPNSLNTFFNEKQDLKEMYLANKHRFDENGHIDKFPLVHLTLGISNKCNGACRMCGHITSSTRLELVENAGIRIHTSDPEFVLDFEGTELSIDLDQVINLINDHNDTLREVTLTGGDPSQADQLPLILDTLSQYKDNITICLISNGTFDRLVDGRLIWDVLDQFKIVHVVFSIDGMPEINEYIRVGLKTRRVIEIAHKCKDYFGDAPNRHISFNSTLSNLNIYYLPEFLDFMEENAVKKGLWVTLKPIRMPHYMAPHNLPPELRKKTLKKLREYAPTNERFKSFIQMAIRVLFLSPFSRIDWYNSILYNKKQDQVTGMIHPLLDSYKETIIESVDLTWHYRNFKPYKSGITNK